MISIIFILLLSAINFNLDSSGDKLLKQLQDQFDQITDISAEFQQSTNRKADVKGKLFFKKEDKFRIEFKNSILVSDGNTNWSYNQKENKLIISQNEEGSASPFSLSKVVYDYPKECTITSEDDNGKEVLVLTPNKDSAIGYSQIKIWVSEANLINRILLKDKADNLIQIDFFKNKVNRKISDDMFNFTPPEGSKVIDLR